MKLTQTIIDELEIPPGAVTAAGKPVKDLLVFDDVQKGLALRVTSSGSKTFLAQYTLDGQRRRVPLGSCGALSLDKARKAVAIIMGETAKGDDVAAKRKAAAIERKLKQTSDALTLEVLIGNWERLHLAGRRPRYRDEAPRALRTAFAKHLALPAAALDRKTVVKIVDGLSAAGAKHMGANVIAYGRACFNWAVRRGAVAVNPFLSLPAIKTNPRDRVMSDAELVEIWAQAKPNTAYGAILRALILTGQREVEVSGMEWGELTADKSSWTIPGARTKNGVATIVPISAPMKSLIESQHRRKDTEIVFAGRFGQFSGWSKCKERLDAAIHAARVEAAEKDGEDPEKIEKMPPWRLHDLRRTLATGLQRLGVRLEVTEAILNHTSGSRAGIVGVYQRHDWAAEKKAALEAWAGHVLAIVGGIEAPSNVVKIPSAVA